MKNVRKKAKIEARFAELMEQYFSKPIVVRLLAEEFECSTSAIYYALRPEDCPKRRVYSDRVREAVALMTLPEIKVYAKKLGKPWRSLYYISLKGRQAPSGMQRDLRMVEIDIAGFFSFGRAHDLALMHLTLKAVNRAKQKLAPFKLTLEPPNRLVYRRGNKMYLMTTAEQIGCVTNPNRFLSDRGLHIASHWEPWKEDLGEPLEELLGLDG